MKRSYLSAVKLFIVLPLILAAVLSGCVTKRACERKFPPQVIMKDSITHSVEYIRHDTTFVIPADSAWYYAFIECQKDSSGRYKPVIINQQTNSGANIHISGRQTDLGLTVTAKMDSLKIVKSYMQKHTKDFRTQEKTIIKEVNVLTGWQWFQVWSGRIFMGLIGIALIFVIVKLALKWFL